MIKKLLLISTFILGIISYSIGQSPIPNPGFENWTTHTGFGTYEAPDNWQTLNQITAIASMYTATKDTHSYAGNYAIRLQGIANIPFIGTMPGILSSGVINQQNFSAIGGGYPINYRPLILNGYYKYDLSAGSDTATMAILLTKWNASTGNRDTVGLGGTFFTAQQLNWTSFTAWILPHPLNSTIIPDTIAILVLSGSLTAANPGALYLDNFSLTPNSAGINEIAIGSGYFSVYPNPASSELSVKFDNYDVSKAHLIVSDLTGRTINTTPLTQQITSLNTSDYANGIYFYRLIDKDNQVLANGKFSIINK